MAGDKHVGAIATRGKVSNGGVVMEVCAQAAEKTPADGCKTVQHHGFIPDREKENDFINEWKIFVCQFLNYR